jgi:hypothetical protein
LILKSACILVDVIEYSLSRMSRDQTPYILNWTRQSHLERTSWFAKQCINMVLLMVTYFCTG